MSLLLLGAIVWLVLVISYGIGTYISYEVNGWDFWDNGPPAAQAILFFTILGLSIASVMVLVDHFMIGE